MDSFHALHVVYLCQVNHVYSLFKLVVILFELIALTL